MPSSTPHQKFSFYHLPTRGRAWIKLGDGWYVSNVSIIFDCSMLLYYLFLMLMGFILHFYIIFGTNLLTGGPAQNCCFFAYFRVSKKSNIKRSPNGINLRERDFLNKRDPGDLQWPSRNKGGRQGRAYPLGALSTLVGPLLLYRRTSSSYIYLRTPKRSDTEPKT